MTDESNIELLECPYCLAQCQFNLIEDSFTRREIDDSYHIVYCCVSCNGLIMTIWKDTYGNDTNGMSINHNILYKSNYELDTYYPNPRPNEWKPRVDLSLVANDKVKDDFEEAISCYNHKLYNACMVTTRRAIQQEMFDKGIDEGGNLYKQIKKTGVSEKFKKLLYKVKDYGNHGAHPESDLFNNDGTEIKSKKRIAALSLEFLDRYLMDAYEIDELLNNAPKTRRELEEIEKKLEEEN